MIELLFRLANDHILIIIDGEKVLFGNTSFGNLFATIDGLKLSYAGVVIEFPELKDNPDWKKEGIKRFKEKIKDLPTEEDRAWYIIEDLRNHGYTPLYKRKKGFRHERIK